MMSRRLAFNVVAAVALLVFSAALVAWVYSYSDEACELRGHDGQTLRQIFVYRGRLVYQVDSLADKVQGVGYESESWPEPWHWEPGVGNTERLWPSGADGRIAGFGYDHYSFPYQRGSLSYVLGTWHERTFWIPLWALLTTTAVMPALVVRRFWIRTRQFRSSCCSQCGYNLTGNTSGVCPECGSAVVKEAGAVG